MIFVLDTNALWKIRGLARLSQAIRARGLRLQVPALVHAERVAQMRRKHGSTFDIGFIQSFIDTHCIEVVSFDRTAAETYAERITKRYPHDSDWHAAKRERCATRFHIVADAGEACPATVDWFISRGHAASGELERVIVVTDDTGVEYDGADILSVDEAIAYVEALPTGTGAGGTGGGARETATQDGTSDSASQGEGNISGGAT